VSSSNLMLLLVALLALLVLLMMMQDAHAPQQTLAMHDYAWQLQTARCHSQVAASPLLSCWNHLAAVLGQLVLVAAQEVALARCYCVHAAVEEDLRLLACVWHPVSAFGLRLQQTLQNGNLAVVGSVH